MLWTISLCLGAGIALGFVPRRLAAQVATGIVALYGLAFAVAVWGSFDTAMPWVIVGVFGAVLMPAMLLGYVVGRFVRGLLRPSAA